VAVPTRAVCVVRGNPGGEAGEGHQWAEAQDYFVMALEIEKVRAIAERVAKDLGLEVADVEFRGGAGKGGRLLRIFIEKAGAAAQPGAEPEYCVTHEDCASLSREVSTILDIEDVVPGSTYLLEVSSPGLDRKLSGAADFRRFTGSRVKVMTRE